MNTAVNRYRNAQSAADYHLELHQQGYAERLPRSRDEYSPMQDEFARTWRGSRYQWMLTHVSISNARRAHFARPLKAIDAEIDQDIL
eukprot:ANDGO_04720.mRNA.1 hypothetical protein